MNNISRQTERMSGGIYRGKHERRKDFPGRGQRVISPTQELKYLFSTEKLTAQNQNPGGAKAPLPTSYNDHGWRVWSREWGHRSCDKYLLRARWLLQIYAVERLKPVRAVASCSFPQPNTGKCACASVKYAAHFLPRKVFGVNQIETGQCFNSICPSWENYLKLGKYWKNANLRLNNDW